MEREGLIESGYTFLKHRIISKYKKGRKLFINDTTLRDGEQTPGVNLFPEEKLRIARKLEELGVDSIDAGFPVSSKSDFEGVKIVAENIGKPVVTALCRARHEDIDVAYEALKNRSVFKRGVSIFIGSSPFHRQKIRKSRREILDILTDSIHYAREKGFGIVVASPEDASRTELEFLCEFYDGAIEAGASGIGFTDTVGILTPDSTKKIICEINENLAYKNKAIFGIHFHNDFGLAVANSLEAIKTGYVDTIQGTITGIGERAGNTALEQLVMAIKLDEASYPKKPELKLEKLYETAKLVEELTGIKIPEFQPIIGENVYRTEAGIHQDGLLKDPRTYLPFDPREVGGPEVVFYLGKKSGFHAVDYELRKRGIELGKEQIFQVLASFKNLHLCSKKVDMGDLIEIAEGVEK